MNKSIKSILIAGFLFLTGLSSASADAVVVSSDWRYSANVTITQVMEWQGDGVIYFQLDNGEWCYIPTEEKNMYGLILSLFMSGRKANIHSHLTAESYAGQGGYRLHRVIATNGS